MQQRTRTPLSMLRAGRAVEREAVSLILWHVRTENGEKLKERPIKVGHERLP
jgi:hypothetical protein